MKIPSDSPSRFERLFQITLFAVFFLSAGSARAADYGRVSGTVTDKEGNPVLGATVIVMGPLLAGASMVAPAAERILTDAHGKFVAEHLLPGWYSLKVTSATRLPALRNGVHVEAGQTAQEKFVLNDIFSPVRFQAPPGNLTTWGDNWKWVLRTSASTRPVLRFQEVAQSTEEAPKFPAPASQKLIGMVPGSTRREALEGDPGMGSVLAYLRPLSGNADLLVASQMTPDGSETSSLAAAIRNHLTKGDPEELTLVVHQLTFGVGNPSSVNGHQPPSDAQAVAASYTHTRWLSHSVRLTTGLEVDYLHAASGVVVSRPNLRLEYRPDDSNTLVIRFGTAGAEADGTLLERVGDLSAFPRVILAGNRPQLETMNHVEASFSHKLGKASRAEVAAYDDAFQNTAVWGLGKPGALAWLAGSVMPNAIADGVTLNAGSYHSSGIRASYTYKLGASVETAVVYASGDALRVRNFELADSATHGDLREVLSNDRSQSMAGKVSARVPRTKTELTTSYMWVERGRVTSIDPCGQAALQLEPFLGVQIRQPLPTLAFLPAHIEALADFRNLLAQGYTTVSHGGEQLALTPAYRSIRGGFSLEF